MQVFLFCAQYSHEYQNIGGSAILLHILYRKKKYNGTI